MFLPKVKFSIAKIKLEVDSIYHFLIEKKSREIIKNHPILKEVLKMKNEKEQKLFIKNYIVNLRKKSGRILKKEIKKYKKDWGEVEKNFLKTLSEILETPWPRNKKIIKAMISINPICPRFLNDWGFLLTWKLPIKKAREIIMHEICHFLYFKKWKEIFPRASQKTFEYPHLEWRLSEILAPVILNDYRIRKILKKRATFYKDYWKLKINGLKLPHYFLKMYEKHLGKNFAEFLKKSYRIIKRHKNLFKNS